MGKVNRNLLESYYQNPGEVYDDKKTEGALEVLANQVDNNDDEYNGRMGEIEQTADEAKTKANEALTNSESTQNQLDTIIVESGTSDAEVLQARTDKLGVTHQTLKDRIDLQEYYVNVKSFGAVGDGTTDDTFAIQNAVDYLVSNGGGIVYLPIGTYLISSSLIVGDSIRVIGGSNRTSILKTDTDIDVIKLNGGYSSLENLKIEANFDGYTSSLITIGSSGGHTWDQKLYDLYLHGGTTMTAGTGILVTAIDKGTMGTNIQKIHFFKLSNGIKFAMTGTSGFINGGCVRDIWTDYTKNTFLFETNAMSRWVFDNCKGQHNTGWTEYHFKNVQGYGHKITNSLQWDGGKILIHPKSSGLYIDDKSYSGTITSIEDYGYRTYFQDVSRPVGGNNGQGWAVFTDDFLGKSHKTMWDLAYSGTGSSQQKLDTTVPYTQGLELSTGTTASSSARCTFGGQQIFNRFSQGIISSYFRIKSADVSNIHAILGMSNTANNQQIIVYIDPSHVNFMMKIVNGSNITTLDTGIPKDTSDHSFQVSYYASSKAILFFDSQHIGTVEDTSVPVYDMEPTFEVKNLSSATDEKIMLMDLYGRVGYRLLN